VTQTFTFVLPSNVVRKWPTGEDDLLTLGVFGQTVTIPRSVMYLLAKSSADKRNSCFCGSFKPYRKCCLERFGYDPNFTEIQGDVEIQNVEPGVSCRFPLASGTVCGCNRVIRSHSSQKSLLKTIADVGQRGERNGSGHVLTMHYNGEHRRGDFGKPIGISDHRVRDKTAGGIFYRFCSKHDISAFSDIENGMPFVGSARQFAQIGYRAACYEDYIGRWQHANVKKRVEVKNLMGWPGPYDIFDQIVGTHQMREIEDEVARYETALLHNDFSGFDGMAFEIEGNLGVVGTGFTRVSKKIGSNEGLGAIGFGVLPGGSSDTTSYVVFSWRKGETAARQFVESIAGLDPKLIPSVLVQVIFSISRSIFFSGHWVDGLGHRAKEMLQHQSEKLGDYSLIVPKEVVRGVKHVGTIQHPQVPIPLIRPSSVSSLPISPYFPETRKDICQSSANLNVVLDSLSIILKATRRSQIPAGCKALLAESSTSLLQKLLCDKDFGEIVEGLLQGVKEAGNTDNDWIHRIHRALESVRLIVKSK
jgi:hypothetical protein